MSSIMISNVLFCRDDDTVNKSLFCQYKLSVCQFIIIDTLAGHLSRVHTTTVYSRFHPCPFICANLTVMIKLCLHLIRGVYLIQAFNSCRTRVWPTVNLINEFGLVFDNLLIGKCGNRFNQWLEKKNNLIFF